VSILIASARELQKTQVAFDEDFVETENMLELLSRPSVQRLSVYLPSFRIPHQRPPEVFGEKNV